MRGLVLVDRCWSACGFFGLVLRQHGDLRRVDGFKMSLTSLWLWCAVLFRAALTCYGDSCLAGLRPARQLRRSATVLFTKPALSCCALRFVRQLRRSTMVC